MAPTTTILTKRPFDDMVPDEFSFNSSVEILMVEPDADVHLYSSPLKKMKMTKEATLKKDLSSYLDFDFESDNDAAVVPTVKDLVSDDVAWLGSQPGSPAHIYHELPGDDDWLSSSPSSPGEDMDLSLGGDSFAAVFGPGDAMDRAAVGMFVADDEQSDIENIVSTFDAAVSPTPEVASTVPPPVVERKPQPPAQPKQAQIQVKAAPKAKAVTKSKVKVSSTQSEPEKADANRWAHNSTERKRRCEIRRLFSDLRDLFPDLRGDDRVSNINTLSRAIQCVADLDREAMEQAISLHQLRERNAALKEQMTAKNGGVLPAKFANRKAVSHKTTAVQMRTIVSDTYPQTIETKAVPITSGKTAEDLIAMATENPSLRRSLPLALRELMDHNSRGVYEAKPLPPRRPKHAQK